MEDLSAYPRPNVAVDVAVLTVNPADELVVLVLKRTEAPRGLALPGRFLRPDETVAECARTALLEKTGIDASGARPHLLRVFDQPGRDPRGWTLSLAHYLVLPPAKVPGPLAPVNDLPPLLFDHTQIVIEAVARMRERYELKPDPDGILAGPFTLADLRQIHQAVLGEPLQRDTFRRRMEPLLEPHREDGTHAFRVDGGRPARLWTVAPESTGTSATPDRVRLPRAR